MTMLYEDINTRNQTFNTETKNILSKYLDKLNGIANRLLNSDVTVDWNYIDHINGMKDLIAIHGLLQVKVGDTIFDRTGNRIVITVENKEDYLKYLKILVRSTRLETATVDELVDDIKDIHRVDNKMSGEDFQTMEIPRTKH